MTHDKAGRRSQRSDPRSCSHSRLVEYEYVEGNKRTGNLIVENARRFFPTLARQTTVKQMFASLYPPSDT